MKQIQKKHKCAKCGETNPEDFYEKHLLLSYKDKLYCGWCYDDMTFYAPDPLNSPESAAEQAQYDMIDGRGGL